MVLTLNELITKREDSYKDMQKYLGGVGYNE